MGRMLSVQTFGEINALFSMMIIFGVFFASITNYISKNISHFHALRKDKKVNYLVTKNYRNLFMIGFVIVLLGVTFSKYISEYLKIESLIPTVLLFLAIFVSIIIPINTGILQGLQRFKMLSFLLAGTGFFRYIICVAFVVAGTGLNGIMIGNILSVLLMGYISFKPIGRHLKTGKESIEQGDADSLSLIIPIILANLSFAILTQGDIVLVKYLFTPDEAGIYSSAAVIGKIVMYLPGAIVIPLFSMVASNKARGEVTLHLVLKALALTILLSGGSVIIFYLFPRQIVSIFFGERFLSAIPIIGLFAIAMLPMSAIMVVMNYNLAKGGRYFAYAMLLCAIIQTAGIVIFHNSLNSILKVILYSGLLCAMTLFLFLAVEYYKGVKSINWEISRLLSGLIKTL
jgi:O-antigen/teichoic acid export membrane protein